MSLEARKALVYGTHLIFQANSQRQDLMNPGVTKTQLVALLADLVAKGHFIEITAVKSDHHDDANLGLHSHFNGYAADCWPLASETPGDYLDASDPRFISFLKDAASSPWIYQIGLAGTAWNSAAIAAAGETVFDDDGADHVHLGAGG